MKWRVVVGIIICFGEDLRRTDAGLLGCRFEAVIHFAGLKAVGESVQKPLLYYDNNLIGTITLLQVMAAHGCTKVQPPHHFIYFSPIVLLCLYVYACLLLALLVGWPGSSLHCWGSQDIPYAFLHCWGTQEDIPQITYLSQPLCVCVCCLPREYNPPLLKLLPAWSHSQPRFFFFVLFLLPSDFSSSFHLVFGWLVGSELTLEAASQQIYTYLIH